MKKSVYLFILLACSLIKAEVMHAPPAQIPVIVNIHTSSDATSVSHANLKALQNMKVDQNLFSYFPADFLYGTKSLFELYKYKLIGTGSCTLFAYLYQRIISINSYLQKQPWSSWKEYLDPERLYPRPELEKELILTIQRQHVNIQNPTDSLSPLITFLNYIEQEISMIKEYLALHKWLNRLYVARFFPFNKKEIARGPQRLTRLASIKQLFFSWVAQQNFISVTCKN